MPALVLCAHRDPAVAGRLHDALARVAGDALAFEPFTRFRTLDDRAAEAIAAGEDLALIFTGVELQETNGVELIRRLHDEPPLRAARKVLIAAADEVAEADSLLQLGALHGRLDPDFDDQALEVLLRNLLTDFVVQSAPHLIDELHSLLDLRSLAGAFSSARDNLRRLSERLDQVERSVIAVDKMSDDRIETEMVQEFDHLLDHPERRHYAAGEVMLHEGDEPGTIWILISGKVKLFRTVEGEDLTFHSESAGRIVGLMSLSLQSPIFFSCRAVTEVTALVLSREQIQDAIHRSPVLSNYLITVILRSMARRNRRAVQLLTQVRTLNRRLSEQRDELASTLEELRDTQERLIDSAKMATLGNLAAGMAHELNNPVAAILAAAGYLGRDLEALLATAPRLAVASAVIPEARELPPRSTREERQLRNALVADLGIESTAASRLVAAGVTNGPAFGRLAALDPSLGDAELISQIDRAGQIGSALRNITNCSTRIAALVRSLKAYARSDEAPAETTEINTTLDDVLLILANKLRDVRVAKHYGELPPVTANASQLQQVWTNLITNAVQAMNDRGDLELRTSVPRPGWVRVEVEDHGRGIPPEAAEHLFEARFTTRGGRVEFGLGLGLPISRSIVRRHGGEISFTSEPGRTVFAVDLPRHPPPSSDHPNDPSP